MRSPTTPLYLYYCSTSYLLGFLYFILRNGGIKLVTATSGCSMIQAPKLQWCHASHLFQRNIVMLTPFLRVPCRKGNPILFYIPTIWQPELNSLTATKLGTKLSFGRLQFLCDRPELFHVRADDRRSAATTCSY